MKANITNFYVPFLGNLVSDRVSFEKGLMPPEIISEHLTS